MFDLRLTSFFKFDKLENKPYNSKYYSYNVTNMHIITTF